MKGFTDIPYQHSISISVNNPHRANFSVEIAFGARPAVTVVQLRAAVWNKLTMNLRRFKWTSHTLSQPCVDLETGRISRILFQPSATLTQRKARSVGRHLPGYLIFRGIELIIDKTFYNAFRLICLDARRLYLQQQHIRWNQENKSMRHLAAVQLYFEGTRFVLPYAISRTLFDRHRDCIIRRRATSTKRKGIRND